jgi:hypothetical protein
MKSSTTNFCLSSGFRRPRPRCCRKRILDSVGRSIITVSMPWRSTPSLKRSTEKMTCSRRSVSSCPAFDPIEVGQNAEPSAQLRLRSVGKVTPFVHALTLTKLEAEVERATRFECRPQSVQSVWKVCGWHMQKAGTCPDAVVTGPLIHLEKVACGQTTVDAANARGGHFNWSWSRLRIFFAVSD